MNILGGKGSVGLKAGLSIGIAGILIVLAMVPGLASAAPALKWSYHAGDGFGGIVSPDMAKATSGDFVGDTITLTAAGTFNPGGPATGGGTFVHTAADGTMVRAMGTWTAVAVVSYETFGNAVLQGLSNKLFGGQLVLAIHLVSSDGRALDGTLTVNCLLGTPPAGLDEGITLSVPALPVTFDMSVHGQTVFVLTP